MMDTNANMPFSLLLAIVVLSAKVCSAADIDKENPWGSQTEKPTVKPAADVMCPVMEPLGIGSYLQIEPWSFMRKVNIRRKTSLYDEGMSNPMQDSVAATPGTESVEMAPARRLRRLQDGTVPTVPAVPAVATAPAVPAVVTPTDADVLTATDVAATEPGLVTADTSVAAAEAAATPGPAAAATAPLQEVQDIKPTAAPADQLLGSIITNFWSWTREYVLYEPVEPYKSIAKIVNPGAFWDNTQDIYNCKGAKVGSIQWEFSWKDWSQGKYTVHKVEDQFGTHIANLREDQIPPNNFFGQYQYYLYLESLSGTPVASMRKPADEWKLGPFKQTFRVDIEVLTEDSVVPLPAMSPEFLSLVFANALAMDATFGPYWNLIIFCSYTVLTIAAVCCCFCTLGSVKEQAEKGKKQSEEEKERLLGGEKDEVEKLKSEGRDFWNCCSRKVTPESRKTNMQKFEDRKDATMSSVGNFKTKVEKSAHEATGH